MPSTAISRTTTVLKRRLGFTLLALALACVSLGGFGVEYWSLTTQTRTITRVLFGVVGLVHGTSSILSAAALWRVSSRAMLPLPVWAVSSLAATWLPYSVSHEPVRWWLLFLETAVFGILLGLVLWYVRSKLPMAQGA